MGQGTNGGGDFVGPQQPGSNEATAAGAYNIDESHAAFLQQAMQYIQNLDPKTVKAFTDTANKSSEALNAFKKLPPEVQSQVMQGQGNQSAPISRDAGMGDIMNFSPQDAMNILQSMGIHVGGSSDKGGGGGGVSFPIGRAPAMPTPPPIGNPSRY